MAVVIGDDCLLLLLLLIGWRVGGLSICNTDIAVWDGGDGTADGVAGCVWEWFAVGNTTWGLG